MKHTQPKFIVTKDGKLRIGTVKRHCELLKAGETCIGGGYYELDYISHKLLLSGASSEYGEPVWENIECLKVPPFYKGLEIIYTSWDSWKEPLSVSGTTEVIYL